MHETALVQNMIETALHALEGHKVTRVNRVTISFGKLSNIMPDAVLFAFESMTQNGILKGAQLEMEYIPTLVNCLNCGYEYKAEGFPIVCPNCRSNNFKIISGDEVFLKSLECEEEKVEN